MSSTGTGAGREATFTVKRKKSAVNKLQAALKHSRPGFMCYRAENCRDVGSSLVSTITVVTAAEKPNGNL